jgi:hypothetical protein
MITKAYAVISTAYLKGARSWYEKLFGREPDATPMTPLHEWYFGDSGVQLLDDIARAGQSRVTFVVDDLEAVRDGLADRGLTLGRAFKGDIATVAQIEDADGNVVTFTQPLAS